MNTTTNVFKYSEITTPLFGMLIAVLGIFLMAGYNSIISGSFNVNEFVGWSIPFIALGLYTTAFGVLNSFSPHQPNL